MSALAALEQPKKHSPLPNSYWVVPGRLAAGEHPGAHTLSDTTDRLQALLFAGVTLFIDLTDEDEGPGYDHLLVYATGAVPLRYERLTIRDHGVPESRQDMQTILETIDAHLAQQGAVYVHCRSGIGRTATVVGCYLVRMGLSGDEALDRLNEVWLESERSHTFPRVPENKLQTDYIRGWLQTSDPTLATQPTPTASRLDHYSGALIGMAIGEAFGAQLNVGKDVHLEMHLVGGGPLQVPPGAWLSDTAMCWSLAESLLASKGSQPQDQMQRYLAWHRDGKYTSDVTIPRALPEMQRALLKWEATQNPHAGAQDTTNLDSHTLARTAAVALFFSKHIDDALNEAVECARTTLQMPLALDANRVFVTAIVDALKGVDKESLLSFKKTATAQKLRAKKYKYPILQIMDGWWRGPIAPQEKGRDALSVLQTALWAFERSHDFGEGLALALKSSGNPSSCGAVYGALAGAYYGARTIPQEWRSAVLKSQALLELAHRLATRSN